ncbi:PleD family two-component system response regulator [Nibricoccus sp. IMCC34717]|uniref:response regulator n=1 Tax=Nibricoccus sp. IMCC34717 TaxID=3034021 RepID=UPI00384C8BAB
MPAEIIVLFVDDDPTTRKIYETYAARVGVRAIMTANPTEAVAILKHQRVDLIVTDLMMPEYDGVELIRAVRENVRTRDIPVIVLTYGGNLERVDTAGHVGANEIHDKSSCPPDKLFARIQALTAQKKPAAS